jgi:DNA polymerase-3 subunit gamma/tau
MSYLVLARKYRPQKFSELIGQQHIVFVLKNALKANKIWHALIFSGMRGTGKTSTARILAKALNCLNPTEDSEPCNKCTNCVDITQGSSVDIIEIDAASNRGIDDIRSLRESVKYVPVKCKYKVYIIDEAHQITDAAFNALLKTLEEPPSYVVFILATTEFNALPLTIVSRCQVFHFRPVPTTVVFNQLKNVVIQENKQNKITDDALQLISELSTGSVRDALSLLDQILSLTEIYDVVDSKTVRQILGYTPTEFVHKYVELLSKAEPKVLFDYINEIYYSGIDLIQFSKDLLEFFHSLLYKKVSNINSPVYNVELFKDKYSTEQVVTIIQQLIRLTEEIKRVEYPKTLFEIYTLRLTSQYKEIDELIKLLETSQTQQSVQQSTTQTTEQNVSFKQQSLTQQKQQAKVVQTQQPQQSKEILNPEEFWYKLLEIIRVEKPLSYPILAESEASLNDDTLTVFLPNKYLLVSLQIQNINLEEIIKANFGKTIKVCYDVKQNKKLVFEEQKESIAQTHQTQQTQQKTVVIKPKKTTQVDPLVEKICSAFSGKIVQQPKKEETQE